MAVARKKKAVAKKIPRKKSIKGQTSLNSVKLIFKKEVEFTAKSPRLAPTKKGPTWELKAYPSITSHGATQNKGLLQLPGRRGITISTGVNVKVPAGWKLCFTTAEALAQKGGIVVNTGHITEGDIFLTIYNVGAAIIPISEGDVVAKAWVEQVHHFEFTEVK